MNRKILLTTAVISIAATCATSVFAQNVTTVISDGGITYSGNAGTENKGKDIFFEVFNVGVTPDETTWSAENASDIVYVNKKAAGDDGAYSFSFKLNQNGLYPIVKNHGGDSAEATEYIGYTNTTDFANAISTLSGKTGTDVSDYIDAHKQDLAMYDEIFTNVLSTDVITLVENSIKADSDLSDLMKVYVAKAFEKGMNISLNNYIGYMVPSSDKLSGYYKTYNEALYSNKLKRAYTSTDDFYEQLREAVILCNVQQSNGVGEITEMLNNYARVLGINVTVTDEISKTVVGKAWTKTELATAVNTYTAPSNGGGGGGSSSSSKNNWGGFGNTTVAGPSASNVNTSNTSDIFSDISNVEWAKSSILNLFNKGIIKGKSEGVFAPTDNVAREELISMLVREVQLNTIGSVPPFADVDKDAWYFSALRAAYNSGISKGYSDELFGVGDKITREDMAVMIYNALSVCGIEVPETSEEVIFADEADIADYANEAVHYLQKRGIISGYENGAFMPKNNATRAEAAVILSRILPYTELGK